MSLRSAIQYAAGPRVAAWILLLSWAMLASGAVGQQLSGAVSLSSTVGYQTNPYLDPKVSEWNPNVTPEFLALDPAVALHYAAPRVELRLGGQARTYLGRLGQSSLPLVRLSGAGQYALASTWWIGLHGGLSRYRIRAKRDTWWAFPSLQWQPGKRTTLTARVGLAGRRSVAASGAESPRQTSATSVLEVRQWLTDRWRSRLSAYLSTSRTGTGTTTYSGPTTYGGTGLSASTTYWWTAHFTIQGYVAFEQVSYDITRQTEPSGSDPSLPISGLAAGETATQTVAVSDRLWRGGAEVSWTAYDQLTLFARAGAMTADLQPSSGASSVDVHLGAGLRWSMGRVLSGRRRARPTGLWQNVDAGVRFDVRYRGDGQVYVTGDFNDWASPGIPLQAASSDRHVATLTLPPGRYEYRIRIVEDGTTRWLDFPDEARTVRDGFGGVNGICVVQ